MHIITKKRILSAIQKHPSCTSALAGWLKIIENYKFNTFAELKAAFNSVDRVGNLIVFNIGDNKLRLIASIHFNRQKLYIRYILSHSEYDKNDWKD